MVVQQQLEARYECVILQYSSSPFLLHLWCHSIAGDRRNPAVKTGVLIPLHEDINPLSGALLKQKFQQAIDSGADVIVLDIHSPGGFTYVTFELMDMVLDAKEVETVAFIEKDAISGAALLSLACDRIIMLPTARIGDAGEIVMGEDGRFPTRKPKAEVSWTKST